MVICYMNSTLEKLTFVNRQSQIGLTPLHCAALNGHTAVVTLLLAEGAATDLTEEYFGRTPLHCAADYGHDEVVRLLLKAAHSGRVAFAKLLLKAGAVMHSEHKSVLPPIHLAAKTHTPDINTLKASNTLQYYNFNPANQGASFVVLSVLVGFGYVMANWAVDAMMIEYSQRDGNTRRTALINAVKHGCVTAATLLLQAGALVHSKDKVGSTPLHYAAYFGHTEVVKLLLRTEACVHIRNKDNMLPMDGAVEKGHTKVVQLLNAKDVLFPSIS
ncbi:hypothetical protein THRCLA_07858 [Thraustotheca clavata]|uniref:Uncharacterized protein n=1 Tax=Thraustotheca clavata TaxID=74557 RepID=A0A1V9ZBU2_9STRA|nr:hypothetical protein THRCLA_07858 [Thraustotheca clavata]